MALPASEILANSWTSAAPGYDELFVPRFAPWTDAALAQLGAHADSLPEGAILVPCCGPGQELPPIAALLPDRTILGTDLAPGMVAIAQARCDALNAAAAAPQRLFAEVGDAMDLTAGPGGGADSAAPPPYAAILSVFGLQQLPDQAAAIAAWVRALAPGGVAVVVYWPMGAGVEESGPWKHWGRLLKAALGDSAARRGTAGWEDALAGAAEAAGAEVLVNNERLPHRIEWPSPDAMWEGMTRSGPWHAQRERRGDEFVDGLREAFVAPYSPDEPVAHRPAGRLLVLRRKKE
jgi:SAM-dependent methyltransferase